MLFVFPFIVARNSYVRSYYPESKVHGANMRPSWVLSAPGGPHIGPMNLAITVSKENRAHCISGISIGLSSCEKTLHTQRVNTTFWIHTAVISFIEKIIYLKEVSQKCFIPTSHHLQMMTSINVEYQHGVIMLMCMQVYSVLRIACIIQFTNTKYLANSWYWYS